MRNGKLNKNMVKSFMINFIKANSKMNQDISSDYISYIIVLLKMLNYSINGKKHKKDIDKEYNDIITVSLINTHFNMKLSALIYDNNGMMDFITEDTSVYYDKEIDYKKYTLICIGGTEFRVNTVNCNSRDEIIDGINDACLIAIHWLKKYQYDPSFSYIMNRESRLIKEFVQFTKNTPDYSYLIDRQEDVQNGSFIVNKTTTKLIKGIVNWMYDSIKEQVVYNVSDILDLMLDTIQCIKTEGMEKCIGNESYINSKEIYVIYPSMNIFKLYFISDTDRRMCYKNILSKEFNQIRSEIKDNYNLDLYDYNTNYICLYIDSAFPVMIETNDIPSFDSNKSFFYTLSKSFESVVSIFISMYNIDTIDVEKMTDILKNNIDENISEIINHGDLLLTDNLVQSICKSRLSNETDKDTNLSRFFNDLIKGLATDHVSEKGNIIVLDEDGKETASSNINSFSDFLDIITSGKSELMEKFSSNKKDKIGQKINSNDQLIQTKSDSKSLPNISEKITNITKASEPILNVIKYKYGFAKSSYKKIADSINAFINLSSKDRDKYTESRSDFFMKNGHKIVFFFAIMYDKNDSSYIIVLNESEKYVTYNFNNPSVIMMDDAEDKWYPMISILSGKDCVSIKSNILKDITKNMSRDIFFEDCLNLMVYSLLHGYIEYNNSISNNIDNTIIRLDNPNFSSLLSAIESFNISIDDLCSIINAMNMQKDQNKELLVNPFFISDDTYYWGDYDVNTLSLNSKTLNNKDSKINIWMPDGYQYNDISNGYCNITRYNSTSLFDSDVIFVLDINEKRLTIPRCNYSLSTEFQSDLQKIFKYLKHTKEK